MSKIQNEDVKTLAQITGAGGAASQLINDTKIYVSALSLNKQLSQAITDGDFATGVPTVTSITNASSPYTALSGDDVILADASSGAITVNLPTAVGISGKIYTIKKTDSSTNAVTIDANSSQTIDGELTKALLSQFECIELVSNNANWMVLDEKSHHIATSTSNPASSWSGIVGGDNVYGDLTSLSLAPGVWDIYGAASLSSSTGGRTLTINLGISTTSGNSATGLTEGDTMFTQHFPSVAGDNDALFTPIVRVTVTSTTTYYFKGRSDVTSNFNLRSYKFTARRIRI